MFDGGIHHCSLDGGEAINPAAITKRITFYSTFSDTKALFA